MTARVSRLVPWVPKLAVGVASGLALGAFASIAFRRLCYPFELEWMEGGSLDQVRFLLAGHRLYGPPSLDFTPFIYPPLYFYVCAAVAKLTGVSFLALRLVSMAATLGSFVLLFVLVRAQTASVLAGFISLGGFAATYELSGFWLDIGRTDALALFFVMASAVVLEKSRGRGAEIGAAVLGAFAFFTKQTALLPCLVLGLPALRRGRSSAATYLGAYGALCVSGTALLDVLHDGWYRFYVFHVPAGHRRDYAEILSFPREVERFAPTLLLLLLALGAGKRSRVARLPIIAWLAPALLATSWLSVVKAGRYANLLIPACAAMALVLGLCASLVSKASPRWEAMASAIALCQLALLAYDPRGHVPSPADLRAGQALVRALAALPGDVFIPFHGALGPMAGKPAHAHVASLIDVASGDRGGAAGGKLDRDVVEALRNHRWPAILLDDPWLLWEIEKYYRKQGPVENLVHELGEPGTFWPMTGRRVRPHMLYVPKDPGAMP